MYFLYSCFLLNHMIPKPRENATKDRYRYYLGLYYTEVCRTTFMDTLAITPARLKSINKRRNKDTGQIKPDGQGNMSEIIIHNTYFPLHRILTIKNIKHKDKTIL